MRMRGRGVGAGAAVGLQAAWRRRSLAKRKKYVVGGKKPCIGQRSRCRQASLKKKLEEEIYVGDVGGGGRVAVVGEVVEEERAIAIVDVDVDEVGGGRACRRPEPA
ncbi:hypothetical protein I7I51_04928 [Histoplasma capsulatum]|uniref:Uncharacterized protein n=1 Tax=Ajellomyces capsulatus TaxID=5037 RepID=A0A8A1M2A4_AJECA|nr:hypothetical protein I7I51_04928 [Histoplasma capsulatum]